jgi:N6-adenosine-specific RNA methylase IME4
MSARIIQPVGALIADPPWPHRDKATKAGAHWGGAENHYGTLTIDDLCRFPLPPLRDDCWLFLWRLHTHQHEAFEVAKAWGFGEPKGRPAIVRSEVVWVKQTLDGSRVRMGMGHGFRMAHEVCLVFKRGTPKRFNAGLPSVIHAPRTEHSRKPEAFYELVDQFVGPVPRAELFARRQWKNWLCLGNEMPATEARSA